MLVQARSLAPAGLEDLSVIRMLSAAPRPQRVDVGHHPVDVGHHPEDLHMMHWGEGGPQCCGIVFTLHLIITR